MIPVPHSDWPILSAFLLANGFDEDQDWDRLAAFRDELYRANQSRNLTRVPPEDFEFRHVVDSLLVAPLLEGCRSVLDLGTGPGFPAWPLAWLLPDVAFAAVDSNSKMASFAKSVAIPNLTVVLGRAEELEWAENFDAVIGRAVAPISAQLEMSAAPCRIGGRVVPFRVPDERELIETFNAGRLGLELSAMIEIPLPGSDTHRLFPIYTKVRGTPPEFPRSWARMKARPL